MNHDIRMGYTGPEKRGRRWEAARYFMDKMELVGGCVNVWDAVREQV